MHGTTRTTTLSPPRHGRRRAGTGRRRVAATMTGVLVASASVVVTTSAAAAPDTLLSQGALTAASSSESGGLGPRFAVDGDRATRWASQPSDDQWLRVDLGEAHDLDRVVLDWEAAYGKDFTVQVSQDGRSWTTVATVADGTGGVQSFDVDATGRYVQVVGTERGTQYGYSLYEPVSYTHLTLPTILLV